jgi:hypothetical protein
MAKKAAVAAPAMDRLGQFEIGLDLIAEMPDLVRRIMGECIIMRAEYLYDRKCVTYTAIHDAFEEREQGTAAPIYEPSYDQDDDKLTWTKA